MCGIVGFWDKTSLLQKDDLKIMTDTLTHRGPDAGGYFFENAVALGHRRLSIIDLSEKANQPMLSKDGRYVLVFNGEIYNFQELKAQLSTEFPNYQFETQSDTEVVLASYICWGESFVEQLEGMFAIAIYDKVMGKIRLYRDRIGIKPLFYYHSETLFAFASELKALLQLDEIKNNLELDEAAINHYLYVGYIPCPHTIYRKIKKMPQGNRATFDGNNLQFHSYWKLDNRIGEPATDEKTAKQTLKNLLEETIEKCLFTDVPFGTFLSGGIDSSLVTAVAQHISNQPINTFSIGFNSQHNEAEYAKSIARYLGTHHCEMYVDEDDAKSLIPELLNIYDEPYGDSSAIPTYILSKMTRQHVTMALSGDGGDELFLGYGSYTWAKRMSNSLLYSLRKPMSKLLFTQGNRCKRVACLLNVDDKKRLKSHIFSQEQYCFTQQEIQQLLKTNTACKLDEENKVNRSLSATEQQSLFDFSYYLPDDLLVKVDRASMCNSLEVRVPLLERKVVEFAFNLEENLRKRGQISKYLLKEVLYDYVPAHFFDRPKWGFSIPLQQWLQQDLHYLIDENLNQQTIESLQIFNYSYIEQLVKRFNAGETYLYNRLWLLLQLVFFLRKNNN